MRADNRLDQKLLVLVTLGLVAFGLVMVYSATSASAAVGDGDPMAFLERQAIYAFLGVVLMALASRFDYHRLRYVAPPLMLVALGLCAAVLVVAPEINGARRWFLLGPASFQPSELAKLALCLFAAVYLARRRPPRTLGELAKPLGFLTAIFCALILLEPDLGTTITLCGMMLAVFLVAGVPARLLATASFLAIAVGLLAIYVEPYRRARVFSFLDPWSDAEGSGFQIVQAMIGIGSGGVTGRRARRGSREDLVPPRGAHGHDLRGDRRGARPRRLGARHRCVRGVRARRLSDRASLSRPVREAARCWADRARLRSGGGESRRGARHRTTHRNPPAVRLLRRLEPGRAPRRGRHSP